MKSKLNRFVLFEPELALRSRPLGRHAVPGWPTQAPAEFALDVTTWLTRAARGLSWNRSGRAVKADLRRGEQPAPQRVS
jgi:hypothetical protein